MAELFTICYHAVSADWRADLSITPLRLRAQVESFLRHGYRPMTFADAISAPGSERRLAVTFDDGFKSVLELGLPVLDDLGVPATAFVPTDYIGGGQRGWPGTSQWLQTSWADELRHMDWDDLGKLQAAGWEIGSHSRSHARLHALGDEELRDELESSKSLIEARLESECRSFAYPYGMADERVEAAAEQAGYVAAAGLAERASRSAGPYRVPRLALFNVDSPRRLRLKTWLLLNAPEAWNVGQALRDWRRGEPFNPSSVWRPPAETAPPDRAIDR